MEHFRLGYRTTKDKSSLELDEIQERNISINKPTVFVFGGNPTTTIEDAGRYARTVQNWLGNTLRGYENDYDIVSVIYNNGTPLQNDFHYNLNYNYRELAKKIMLPCFFDDNYNMDLIKAKKQLSMMTFFTHSAGALVFDQMMIELDAILRNFGLSKRMISELFQQVKFVTYSPFAMLNVPVKAIYITPAFDELGSSYKLFNYCQMSEKIRPINREQTAKRVMNIAKNIQSEFDNDCYKVQDIIERNKYIAFTDDKNMFAIVPGKLTKGDRGDHGLLSIVRGDKNEVSPYATEIGYETSQFIQSTLKTCVKNALINESSYRQQKLNIPNICDKCVDMYKNEDTISNER